MVPIEKTKIYYIENLRLPTEKAHGVQIVKMCAAFAEAGTDLTLLLPNKKTTINQDIYEYYGVARNFKIKKIFSLNLNNFDKFLGKAGFVLENIIYGLLAILRVPNRGQAIIYTRQLILANIFSLFSKNVFYEGHNFSNEKYHKFSLNRVAGIVVISGGLERIFKKIFPAKKIITAFDGVDLSKFDINIPKDEARKQLNLPLDKKLVVYTGNLYKWKGADTLALSQKYLDADTVIVFAGGHNPYLNEFRELIKTNGLKNIFTLGHQEYSKVPYFLQAADCLVLTGTNTSQVSKEFTSPMKMFEYMASHRLIVASELDSFKEVLNDDNCILVESDNPQALAEGIKKALAGGENIERQIETAYNDVLKYSWLNRVKLIMSIFKQ